MTVISISLRDHATLDISDARQHRIMDKLVADDTLMYCHPEVQEKMRIDLRRAITHMGPWDLFTDWALHGSVKRQALKAIATKMECDMTSPGNELEAIQNEQKRLNSIDAFFSQLSPHGMRVILDDPHEDDEGMRFQPKTGSNALNQLLCMTLPYDLAARYLEHARLPEPAAVAFEKAGDCATSQSECEPPWKFYESAALQWNKIRGGEFRAQLALRKFTSSLQQEADAQSKDGHHIRAAVAFEKQARGWRVAGDYAAEHTAWGKAAECWTHAANARSAVKDPGGGAELVRFCQGRARKAEARKERADAIVERAKRLNRGYPALTPDTRA